MKISVVTTSFNQAQFLEETLESVRMQRYAQVEQLVIDGGSTDDTLDLLKSKTGPEWQHLNWISEADGGQSEAMNKGLRRATGDVIGWLNSDDRYRPGCLATVARAFAEYPEADILYGDTTFIDEQGKHMRIRREPGFSPLVLHYHHIPGIPTTATFFRRRIFDEGNFLDESMHYAMDHEFFVRLLMKGHRFQHIPALLADFRWHSESKTCASAERQLEERNQVLHRQSPIALKVKSKAIRRVCFAVMAVVAGVIRYGEKLVRGYYLPDGLLGRMPDMYHEDGGR